MAWRRYLACGAGLLLAAWCFPVAANAAEPGQDAITLINGVVIQGRVTGLSPTGLVMQIGSSSRSYPWVALAPGSRFRYDTSYRMNFAGHLSGADVATLTNQPDPNYDPMNPTQEQTEPEPEEAAPTASNLFTLVWQDAAPVVPKDLRSLDESLLKSSRFWSVRIGTAEKDVVLVALKDGAPPAVSMMPLGDSRAATETAKEEGAGVWHFSRRVFPVNFGTNSGEVSLEWRVSDVAAVRRVWMQADVVASMGGDPVRFSLSGAPPGWLSGADSLVPQYVVAPPALRWLVVINEGEVSLAGEIRMGMWRLSPGEGMARKVSVEVLDAKGESVMRDDLAVGQSDDDSVWPLNLKLVKLTPGATYLVKASIDLGPWLGRAESEYSFVMPDAQKL